MEVVVTSRDTIKPSIPTPNHLRHMQLSFFDQMNPPLWMSFLYLYSHGSLSNDRCEQLKKSLSETLSTFYPLAGRVNDQLHVDCNDEGVDFFQAQVKCKLLDVTEKAGFNQLIKLLPYRELEEAGNLVLGIQVNFFECGNIGIGVSFNHKVLDALSFVTFFNSWAAASRLDNSKVVRPRFGLAHLFPPKDMPKYQINPAKDIIVDKQFVFSDAAISSLKAKHPMTTSTRVETLCAFIWSRFIAVQTKGSSRKQQYLVLQSVNLRPRLDLSLSEFYFGNLVATAAVTPSIDSSEESGTDEFLIQMREAIRKVDGAYVKNIQRPGLDLNYFKEKGGGGGGGGGVEEAKIRFSFTSLSRYQLYEADFGWGKPILVTMCNQPYKNTVILFPTRSGDGILVSFYLESDDMAKLEADKEFQAFASPTLGLNFNFLDPSSCLKKPISSCL